MDKYIIVGLIILMIVLLIIHSNQRIVTEKFIDQQLPNIEACPADLNRYTTDRGVNCCDGPIENGQCNGTPRCTLSNNVPGLIRCIEYITSEDDLKSMKYCPKGTQYFNDRSVAQDKNIVGFCTASKLSPDRRRRLPPLDNMCTIYKDQTTNEGKMNSCWIRKKMQTILKPVKDAKVHADESGFLPVIFRVEYIDELQTKNCLDRENMESILDKIYPAWRGDAEFKKAIYDKWEFCDLIREKMEARAKNPDYVNPVQKFVSKIRLFK